MMPLTTNISTQTFHIAGILTTVHGLEELSSQAESISCLWLLHPRLASQDMMTPVATAIITQWNMNNNNNRTTREKKGLIAVSFDQRNHGSRILDARANQSWKDGNARHAQDMFGVIHGTAVDTSLLIDHLASYILSDAGDPPIEQHLVMGISLGGHAAWQVIFTDPRVTAAVIVIGCPDYQRVMTDRARLSKLPTYTPNNGATFITSPSFPRALVAALHQRDPKGIIFGADPIPSSPLSPSQQASLAPILDASIRGKSIQVLSGQMDKLVPYHASEPFLAFLKEATGPAGWYADGKVYVEDNVYDGVGHAYSEEMKVDAARFVCHVLAHTGHPSSSSLESF